MPFIITCAEQPRVRPANGLLVSHPVLWEAALGARLGRVRAVAVPVIHPQRPVAPEHPPAFAPKGHHPRHVLLGRRLEPPLALLPVVAQPPVRRARHDAVNRLIRQPTQAGQDIRLVDSPEFIGAEFHVTTFSRKAAKVAKAWSGTVPTRR